MLFYSVLHVIFFILQNKKIYPSTFVTEICLFSSFAFSFSLDNYFFCLFAACFSNDCFIINFLSFGMTQ